MKCLNPKCQKDLMEEEGYLVCNHCGISMSIEVYTIMHSQLAVSKNDYRDRVDRMVAAAYSGYWANPEQITFEHEKVVESSIEHIDAIDKALAELEACDDK